MLLLYAVSVFHSVGTAAYLRNIARAVDLADAADGISLDYTLHPKQLREFRQTTGKI